MAIGKTDFLVIGGGIMGAFHAYHALRRGLTVRLLEKDIAPQGATVRNFGQVVPSGMNAHWQRIGRQSLAIYRALQSEADFSFQQNGSYYIASDAQELQLLEELHAINRANEYPSALLTAQECIKRLPHLKESYVKGGLFFSEDMSVDPRLMIHRLLAFMQERYGLDYRPRTLAAHCEVTNQGCLVKTASGETFASSKVLIATGWDFKNLFPSLFAESDLVASKLQMLQTTPYPSFKLVGNVLTGLTIRRYESFHECPSFSNLSRDHLNPLLKEWGIHILFKQASDGTIILGDSHEYQDAKNADLLGFDTNQAINDLIIAEAQKIFAFPHWNIRQTWFGIYAQCADKDVFLHTIDEHIYICTGIGGKGMTASAGFSENHLTDIFG